MQPRNQIEPIDKSWVTTVPNQIQQEADTTPHGPQFIDQTVSYQPQPDP